MIVRELLTRLGWQVDDAGARRYEAQFDRIKRHAATLQANLGGIVGMFGSAFVTGTLLNYADSWTSLSNAITATETALGMTLAPMSELNEIANRARSPIEGVVDLYGKMARASGELGLSTEDLTAITETVSKSFSLSGASAGTASGAIMQLGQAMGSGALRGDELNSILEGAPILAQAIADEMGVSIGQLKELGKEGAITSRIVADAILHSQENIDKQFAATRMTVGQSMAVFTNKAKEWIGTTDEASGVTLALANSILFLSDHFDKIAIVIGTLMIPAAMSLVVWVASTVTAFAGLAVAVIAATWPFILAAGAIAGLVYAGYELYKWFTGGDTILNDWLGTWQDVLSRLTARWDAFVAANKAQLQQFKDEISAVLAYLSGVWERFVAGFATPWSTLWTITLPGVIEAFVPGLFDPLREAWDSALAYLGSTWSSWTGGLGDKLRSMKEGVLGWWGGEEEPAPKMSGARATGGPVRSGRAYMVGEEGPEPFVPKRSGWILPHGLRAAMAGPAQPPTTGSAGVHQTVNIGGVTVGDLNIQVPKGTTEQQSEAILQAATRRMQETLTAAIRNTLDGFTDPEVA